jgi:HicB family
MSTLKNFDPNSFTVHTECVNIEGSRYFRTSVFELPDVEVYEKTAAEAYETLMQCIVDLHEAAVQDGRTFPGAEKRGEADYSGRVTLRMRKELHKRLDLQAKRNGTTLNAEIVTQLSDTSSIREMAFNLSAEMLKASNALPKAIVISTGGPSFPISSDLKASVLRESTTALAFLIGSPEQSKVKKTEEYREAIASGSNTIVATQESGLVH